MKRAAAYAILVLGLLGVVAATHSSSKANGTQAKTADYMPWPPK